MANAITTRLFAWNGLSFLVPGDWDLAHSQQDGGIGRLVLEDLLLPRLEVDWQTPVGKVRWQDVHLRCQTQASKVAAVAVKVLSITGLADNWTAHEYYLSDGRCLIVAYLLPKILGQPFVFFRMHFANRHNPTLPGRLFRELGQSFRWHSGDCIPWNFYDVTFLLSARFRLTGTGLDAGRKLLAFEWGLRRLYLWHFSLAEMLRQQKDYPQWTADFLNVSGILPVPFWRVDAHNLLSAKRKKRFLFGQFEEIGRLCFQYAAGYRHLPEKNQLAVWVFQYRREEDRQCLNETLKFALNDASIP